MPFIQQEAIEITTHLGATGTDSRADAETVAAEEAFGAELTWCSPAALGFVISVVPTNTSSGFHVTGLNLTHHRGHCCCQVRGSGGEKENGAGIWEIWSLNVALPACSPVGGPQAVLIICLCLGHLFCNMAMWVCLQSLLPLEFRAPSCL